MQRVRNGERAWVYLGTLHRESLDELLDRHGIGAALDDAARARLVRAWHLLPAWPDAVEGLALLDVELEQVLMVAAHSWDIGGASAAGLRTAFLERPNEKGPQQKADRAEDTVSDLSVDSFVELAERSSC